MKVSREQVAENRQKILESASRLFRERGYAAVSVAEIMEAAGLTHGAFYGYFSSKDELVAQTLAYVMTASAPSQLDLTRFTKRYLSAEHRDNLAEGCPTAALAAETVRLPAPARAAMTAGVRRQLELFTESAPGKKQSDKRRHAIGSWAAMVGALVLARLSDDAELSDELLTQTRAFLREAGARGTSD